MAILFGRSRASEDIDIFIEKLEYAKFEQLWHELNKNYECLNTTKPKEAYNKYLQKGTSIRFSKKGKYIPNMEVKFATEPASIESIKKKIKIILNDNILYTSPLEMQIAFKMFLGSEKDIEDARYLYKVFKEHLNLSKLSTEMDELKVKKELRRYLK